MKFGLVIIALCALNHFANGQTGTTTAKKVDYGIEGSISSGFIHALNFGGSLLIKKRHGIGLAVSGFPSTNPYKGTWGKGLYLDYSYFIGKKRDQRLRAFLYTALQSMNYNTQRTSEQNENTTQVNYIRKAFANVLGIGAALKLHSHIFLKTSLSIYTVGYYFEEYRINYLKTGKTYLQEYNYFYYNDFSTFSLDDLTLRFSINYYFK